MGCNELTTAYSYSHIYIMIVNVVQHKDNIFQKCDSKMIIILTDRIFKITSTPRRDCFGED